MQMVARQGLWWWQVMWCAKCLQGTAPLGTRVGAESGPDGCGAEGGGGGWGCTSFGEVCQDLNKEHTKVMVVVGHALCAIGHGMQGTAPPP